MAQHNSLTDSVAQELIKLIYDGKHEPGHQLPSVDKLASQMAISRSTMREALRLLQAMGMVEIIHGRGIFVRKPRLSRMTGTMYSLSEFLEQRGMKPYSLILERRRAPADEDVAKKLDIAPGELVNILRRLRFADGVSFALEVSILACSFFPDLIDQEWTPETSLYTLLQTHYYTVPSTASHVVQAVAAGDEEARLLGIPPGSPLMRVETITCDQNQRPIEFGISLYRGDRYEYQVNLRRESGG